MSETKKEESIPENIEKAVNEGNLNLEQRIMKVMQDVFDLKIKALEEKIDLKIDELLKSKEVEMEQALRKGFGLENDPVIHNSDLQSALRKAALDMAENKKRTPPMEQNTPIEKATDPFDKAVQDQYKKIGVA